jgi:hypothetical protein
MWVDVLDWAKDSLAEQTVAFWLLGSVVNGFGLGNFTVAPLKDIYRTCNGKTYCVKVGNIGSV